MGEPVNTEKDKSTKLEYSSLSASGKVRAILCAVMEPVTPGGAVELSGVKYDQLDDKEKAEVKAVFSEEDIENVFNYLFIMNDEGRQRLAETVDMRSVHQAISDQLLKGLGLDI